MDFDLEGLAGSLVFLISGFVFFNYASTVKHGLEVNSYVGIGLSLVLSLYGFVLLFAAFSDRLRSRGKVLAWIGVLVVAAASAHAVSPEVQDVSYDMDAALFARYSADLVLQGQNPYTSSMQEAYHEVEGATGRTTPKVDGTYVDSFVYPALGFLVFVPQLLAGVPYIGVTLVLFLLASAALLVDQSPGELAVLAPALFLAGGAKLVHMTVGGNAGFVWVFFLLLAMKYWESREKVSMIFLGISFAVKQVPWMIAFFLAYWFYHSSDDLREFFGHIRTSLVYGGGTFFAFNIPFLLASPVAWMRGVMMPIFSETSYVALGGGPALLSTSTVSTVPKSFFLLAMALVFLLLSLFYNLYFEELKWTAWIVPGLVFWFNYRFLPQYFLFFVPVAFYALVLKSGYSPERGVLQFLDRKISIPG